MHAARPCSVLFVSGWGKRHVSLGEVETDGRQLTEVGSVVSGFRPGFLGALSPVSCLFALPSGSSFSSSGWLRFSLSLLSELALAEASEALEPGRSPTILA